MTTIAEYLSCTVENGVATLTLNHPPVNALTLPILAQLEAALDGLVKDDRVKVMILTGTGRIFIAGADIKVIVAIASSDEGNGSSRRSNRPTWSTGALGVDVGCSGGVRFRGYRREYSTPPPLHL